MTHITQVVKYLMGVSISLFLILTLSTASFAEEPEIPVTIIGKVANFEDIGPYMTQSTHLQLYPCDTTGKMNVQMGKNGKIEPVPGQEKQRFYLDKFNRLVPPSPYPRFAMSVFGDFNFFRVKGLEPGKCYKICVMMLDAHYPSMVPLVDKDGKPFTIIIPEPKAGEDLTTVDLTKDDLRIPEPGTKKK